MKEFNEAEVRARFLDEVARLKHTGRFVTDADFCKSIRKNATFLSELINHKPNRNYFVTTEVLFYCAQVYAMDIRYVITGNLAIKPGAKGPGVTGNQT